MNADDYKRILHEVLDERKNFTEHPYRKTETKKQMILTNLMVGLSTFVFILTWIVAAYSWFAYGTFPGELVRYSSVVLGLSFCGYCCKTACEYKADKDYESRK